MPKKSPRNGFYFYMQEAVIPQLRREGKYTSMEAVVQLAHPRWKALAPQEKERYDNMAKEYKARMRGQEGDKYRMDNVGNCIADRKNPLDELKKRKQKEKVEVTQRWPVGKKVIEQKFYFIDFQTFCKTEEGDYLPAELGLVEFTLKDGIKKTYHTFIDPGPIPLGYRFECTRTSEDTHKIPVEGFELANKNHRNIWIQLENFVNPNGEMSYYPYIFCPEIKIEEVEYCMSWLHGHACLGIPNRLRKIAHLENVVQELYKHIQQASPSEQMLHDVLTTSVYDYESGVMCAWHEENESKDCSLGKAKIYCYAISDAMANLYDLQLTKNHLPTRSLEPVCSVIIPVREPERSPWQSAGRGKGRGKGRGAVSNEPNFPARDFRENDKAWQKQNQPAWGRKNAEPEYEQFEPAEPELSTSLRKPKKPGMAAQIDKVAKGIPQTQTKAPGIGEYGTLVPKAAEIDVGVNVRPEFRHPAVPAGTVLYSRGQAPPPRNEEDEWPSLGAAPEPKPKYAGRAGPPPAQLAPQPPAKWQNGAGLSNMQDIASSLGPAPAVTPPRAWGPPPPGMMLAGIGRGRGAFSPGVRPPPGMAQPTVLPKKSCK